MKFLPIAIAGMLGLGMGAQWLAWRFRIPSILLLLGFGFGAGQFVKPDDFVREEVLLAVVSAAVATILLEGGLSLRFRDIRETRFAVFRLCTLGALVAWGLTTAAAHWLVGINLQLSALLGAILVVTGPTVIGPLLRHIKPVRSIGAVAKWEGIVVDPIGAMLAVLVFQVIRAGGEGDATHVVLVALGKTLLVGGLGGFLLGKAMEQLLKRHLIPDFLHSPVLLAVALTAHALSNQVLPEVGLLTVTVLGVTLANQRSVSLSHVLEFKENLSVLLISCLFIVLAARIELGMVKSLGFGGLLFLVALIALVRPLSVMFSTFGKSLTWNQRVFLSFLAPRGIVAAAVTSVFSLEVIHAAAEGHVAVDLAADAAKLVPLTFVVIIGTVAIYGLAAAPLARRLGLASQRPEGVLFLGGEPWVVEAGKMLKEGGIEVLVVDRNATNAAAARMAGLRAVNADALSSFVAEELELFGIGRLLAVTPNFEVNTLACEEFIHQFGRGNVYQFGAGESSSQRTDLSHRTRGRTLFDAKVTHDALTHWWEQGARIKRTSLTEKYTFADFRARYGEHALPLFALGSDGRLKVMTPDSQSFSGSGTLISLIRESGLKEEGQAADADSSPPA